MEDLSNASKKGCLQESLLTYTHPHVLVVDEVGYLTYGPDAANVLFHVVNDRHLRKRPMIFTTNKPLSEWGKVLHDEDLAAAILDRILERGRFVPLRAGIFKACGGLSSDDSCAVRCKRRESHEPPGLTAKRSFSLFLLLALLPQRKLAPGSSRSDDLHFGRPGASRHFRFLATAQHELSRCRASAR